MRTESDGIAANEISALTSIAPLDKWDLQWDENLRKWITAVTCPNCGEHLQFEIGALDDFYCSMCDYGGHDGSACQPPVPACL